MENRDQLLKDIETATLDAPYSPIMAKQEAIARLKIEWGKDSFLRDLLDLTRELCCEDEAVIKIGMLIAALGNKE